MAVADIPLPGEHNVSNVLAAVAVGLLYRIDPGTIAAAVRGFGGVEHRLGQPPQAVGDVRVGKQADSEAGHQTGV